MVTKVSMRATIMAMEPKEVIVLPLQNWGYNSIRNCACNVGISLSRKYSVHLDREAQACKVIRHE